MDRYVVIGNPVSHSLSPEIHALFAAQLGEAIAYERLEAPLAGFAGAARRFFAEGGRGANVTLPFKVEAMALADTLAERARLAGAVNTLTATPSGLSGDNTDGAGLVADLTGNLGLELAGRRVLVLGAGGAARGVIAPLLALGIASLTVANRTIDRAAELAERFRGLGSVTASGLEPLAGAPFDLVVNATSASTRGEALAIAAGTFAPGALAYDMAYGPAAAAFLGRAKAAGAARCADGLGMLVEQAAESFRIWRGSRPRTAEVLARLRARAA